MRVHNEGARMLKCHAVILAGGQGARFWPVSRMRRPKQFLSIAQSGETLIQATAQRAKRLAGAAGVLVVTNQLHEPLIHEELPWVRTIAEPVARNTAASIGLAAAILLKEGHDEPMVVLPADHAVADTEALLRTWETAVRLAAAEPVLVTIGVTPTFPHTGYGYIERGAALGTGFAVKRFYEKPNLSRAKRYFDSGNFLWNSGMFVWRPSVLMAAIEEFMPELGVALKRIGEAWSGVTQSQVMTEAFEKLESVSIDFGILEHARNCAVVPAEPFGWNDVGSWDQWADHFTKDENGNLLHGDAMAFDAKNCVVYSKHKFVAVLGTEDLIVIDEGDALLVCPRERVQDVRVIVEALKKAGRANLV